MSDRQTAAYGRITALLDANSFVEIGSAVTARNSDFNLLENAAPSDGVVTGYGTVDGSLVFVYSQDASVLGGTVGEMHAKKIVNLYRMARRMGAPIVGMLDSEGLRLEESSDALHALGAIYRNMTEASGVIPQIVSVYGNCGGGLSFLTALADFSFMESGSAKLFVNAPDTLEGNTAEKNDTSAPLFQAEAGNADFTGSAEEIASAMRELLSLLPGNNEDEGEFLPCTDDPNRSVGDLTAFADDAAKTLAQIADNGLFFETNREHAKGIVTGLLRLNGQTVGCVANRVAGGELSSCGAEKAAAFIRFLDAFNIPLLTLASVSGYRRTEKAERNLPRQAAALAFAYADATVPKVTVVTGDAIGSAYVLMGSKALGADMVYAWPNASIGAMDAKMAAKLIAGGDAEKLADTEKAYADLQMHVSSAAKRGYVDGIIEAADTRKYLIGAFEMLYTKRESRPDKKHGSL